MLEIMLDEGADQASNDKKAWHAITWLTVAGFGLIALLMVGLVMFVDDTLKPLLEAAMNSGR